jgi:hypothetical protein
MINIRIGVFETNSSSTHSIVVLTKEQYKALKSEGAYVLCNREIDNANDVKLTWDEADIESGYTHNFEYYIDPECDLEKICAFDNYLVFRAEVFEL